MYPTIDENEKMQVAEVFGLTGGELADEPLRYAYKRACGDSSPPRLRRRWARYFYDGTPDYARIERKLGGSFVTIVTCELFGAMPQVIYARGKRWRRVARFTNSGETECPYRDEPSPRTEACPLCEAPAEVEGSGRAEGHGEIYIGEGWVEVVYRARD